MLTNKLIIDPPLIAHRGASKYAPENTFAAFYKAKELGIQWVEFDVMLTADEEVVVIHDKTLDRTTNGKGLVSSIHSQQLQTFSAGAWFHQQFVNEKIPTLSQLLHLLAELNLSANIEIKSQAGREELTVKKILGILEIAWQKKHTQLFISSFSEEILNIFRKYSALPMGFLMDEWDDNWYKKCDALQCATVNVNHLILNAERAQIIKTSSRLLLAYTVNDAKRMHQLFSWGVDAVFTDDPMMSIK